MDFNKQLYLTKIILDREKIPDFSKYPFIIPVVKNFTELTLDSPVTFFIGENGIGKSTFIEAIAVNLGLPKEGGTQNFTYDTNDTTSELYKYLRITNIYKPKMKFFLRAESFYNFSSEIENLAQSGYVRLYKYYGGDLHKCSHGESFLKVMQNRFTDHGLYILDEPEAALSAQSQLSLLCLIDDLVKQGSQFIIATHSPILISYRNAKILDLNKDFQEVKYEDTDIYQLYKLYMENPYGMQKKLFDNNEE